MGVDFFPCEYCEKSICDCGDYVSCEECGFHFCDDDCAQMERDEDGVGKCRYCQGIDATSAQLLNFLMKRDNLSLDDLYKMYKDEFKRTNGNVYERALDDKVLK